MASSDAKRILRMTALAVIVMQVAAATARDVPAPTPTDATYPVTLATRNDDNILQWLKITAVPLVVFLVGTCTWGLIKNMALWKRLTAAEVESPNSPLERTTNSNLCYNRDAPDLEVGLEMSQRRNVDDEDRTTTPALDATVQYLALEAPHDDGRSAVPEAASQLY